MKTEMTDAQHEAIKAFAATYGRSWKKELQNQWMKAKACSELQALRNTHGPSWLIKVKI